jgi:CRISPR/Cas system-associated protein endoribonuclease Cas2
MEEGSSTEKDTNWPRIYLLVLGFLVLQIVVYAALSRILE